MPKQRHAQIRNQLRRENRERKGQARFLEIPTAKKARHTARAEANLAYKPVLRGIRSDIAGSAKREGELKDWYGGLSGQIAQSQKDAAASSQASEAALTQRLANASASDTTNLQDLASKNEATAKLLGGPTNSRGLAEAAAGNTAVAQQRVALTSPLSASRANYQNYLGQRGVSATERGIESVKAETARKRKLKEDLLAGRKERGEKAVEYYEKLRGGARDYSVQQQAFGQQNLDRKQGAREGALDRAQDETASRRTAQSNVRSNAQDERASIRGAKNDGSGGLTASEKRTRRESNRSAMAALKRTIRAEGLPKDPKEWAGLEVIVAGEDGVNAAQARAAVRRWKSGRKRKPKPQLGHSHR